MASLRDLEEHGSAEVGVSVVPAQQTRGGSTNLRIVRRYRVAANVATQYLFQILNPAFRITDPTFPDAYLVDQSLSRQDDANAILTCEFCQVPTGWDEAYPNPVPFPGVLPSSLMSPYDFKFRSSPQSLYSAAVIRHSYQLGPLSSIATLPVFQPVDQFGNKTSVLDDWTDPSSDRYVAAVDSRQEIVISSVIHPWRGDIWDLRSLVALAK